MASSQQFGGSAAAPALAPVHIQPARRSARLQLKVAIIRLAVVLACVFTIRYFIWRFHDTSNPAAMWFFWIFLGAEVMNFGETALFYFISWNPTRYATPQPIMGRTVDVFIATYNEPVDLLRETLVCALSIRYPHTTYVLDDGARPEVEALARELRSEYIARTDRSHAKAGNLNNALSRTSGEFVVTLDADHVPSPEFIDELIGFFADPQIGIVQTHQDFYNLDSFQHLLNFKKKFGWQQQELFFNVIQPGKDYYNAAFYCGSPAMIRRSALDEVDGFATGTVTEDMHTGIKMQKKGWRVLYHNKTLARGLAPQTFVAFATQWQRWGHGAMQVLRRENPLFGRGLSFSQRFCYFASFYFYLMSYQKLLYALTPVFCLLSGVFPLLTEPSLFVLYFGPYFVLNTFSSVMLQGGLRSAYYTEQFNILKLRVMMESIGGLFRRRTKFKVTPKAASSGASWSDLLLHVSLTVVLSAAALAGIEKMSQLPNGYEFWALAVNLFWAVFYIFLLLPLIFRAMKRKEVRQSYRWPARLDIAMRYTRSGRAQEKSYARNLNRTGVSITTDDPFTVGEVMDLELDLPEKTIKAVARVMRNQPYTFNGQTRFSNGLRFDAISPADQDEISKYLFFEIAPREGSLLRLTHTTQSAEVYS